MLFFFFFFLSSAKLIPFVYLCVYKANASHLYNAYITDWERMWTYIKEALNLSVLNLKDLRLNTTLTVEQTKINIKSCLCRRGEKEWAICDVLTCEYASSKCRARVRRKVEGGRIQTSWGSFRKTLEGLLRSKAHFQKWLYTEMLTTPANSWLGKTTSIIQYPTLMKAEFLG